MAENNWWESFSVGCWLDKEGISGLLPHRGHMSLLNRVAEGPDKSLVAEILLAGEAFWVAGHFPVPETQTNKHFTVGPVFPGVLMVESAAQLGICYWRKMMGIERTREKLMLFREITKAVFKKEARPGERLFIIARMEKCSIRMMRCQCEGVVLNATGITPCFECNIAGLSV